MDQHPAGLDAGNDLRHPGQDGGGQVGQALAGPHQVEIDIGAKAEDRQYLPEHFPVLTG